MTIKLLIQNGRWRQVDGNGLIITEERRQRRLADVLMHAARELAGAVGRYHQISDDTIVVIGGEAPAWMYAKRVLPVGRTAMLFFRTHDDWAANLSLRLDDAEAKLAKRYSHA